jgi:hypothetical protein
MAPWTWRKRQRPKLGTSNAAGSQQTTADDEVEMETYFERAFVLQPSLLTFDSDSPARRIELARKCWSSSQVAVAESLQQANPELAGILHALVVNTYRPSDREAFEQRQFFRVEGVLTNLLRMQSQKQIPLLTARLSIAAYRAQMPEKVWLLIHAFVPGIIASEKWTHDFVDFAAEFRPECQYEELVLVGGTMFDNYSRKVLYKSQATNDSAGYQLNMTNWATMKIPKLLAPANFDPHANCIRVHASCSHSHLTPAIVPTPNHTSCAYCTYPELCCKSLYRAETISIAADG